MKKRLDETETAMALREWTAEKAMARKERTSCAADGAVPASASGRVHVHPAREDSGVKRAKLRAVVETAADKAKWCSVACGVWAVCVCVSVCVCVW